MEKKEFNGTLGLGKLNIGFFTEGPLSTSKEYLDSQKSKYLDMLLEKVISSFIDGEEKSLNGNLSTINDLAPKGVLKKDIYLNDFINKLSIIEELSNSGKLLESGLLLINENTIKGLENTGLIYSEKGLNIKSNEVSLDDIVDYGKNSYRGLNGIKVKKVIVVKEYLESIDGAEMLPLSKLKIDFSVLDLNQENLDLINRGIFGADSFVVSIKKVVENLIKKEDE